MDILLSVLMVFPLHLRQEIQTLINENGVTPEEIRVKIGSPMTIRNFKHEIFGKTRVTKKDMLYIVGSATECSYHAVVKHLANGFLPMHGGVRMGVCGCGRGENGVLCSLDEITSVCFRIPSEKVNCFDLLFTELFPNGFTNTIIIAPPGLGKTTLLRELIRKLSYNGLYIGVADERGEISGQRNGQASFDLGPRCDVLTGIRKADAAMMLLRSMSPNVIAMDEITAHHDMEAILHAVGCGVGLLTTMHGEGLGSLDKPIFSKLHELKLFENAVLIFESQGERVYEIRSLYV